MTASVLQSTTLPAAGCGKSVSGRESSAETVGPGFVFQVTPDVAAINAFMRVVVAGVEFEGGWSQQRHWKGRGAGQSVRATEEGWRVEIRLGRVGNGRG